MFMLLGMSEFIVVGSYIIVVFSLVLCRTVLYELLTRRYPFSSRDATGFPLTPSVVIYLVGRGCRQEITSRDANKRLKVGE